MKTIAVYNLKGGVGKTSMAVSLAALSAAQSARRTLLWDLDPQRAASWLVSDKDAAPGQALALFDKSEKIARSPRPSQIDGVDLIAADGSLRDTARWLAGNGGKRRLAKLADKLSQNYDRLILDCAPGLDELTDQILRAADVVIVPIIPSPLSERAFAEMVAHVRRSFGKKEKVALLPVFSMVDLRRARHREALASHPDWPVIPMASAVEQMAERREPLNRFAASSPPAKAYARLWQAVERRLTG